MNRRVRQLERLLRCRETVLRRLEIALATAARAIEQARAEERSARAARAAIDASRSERMTDVLAIAARSRLPEDQFAVFRLALAREKVVEEEAEWKVARTADAMSSSGTRRALLLRHHVETARRTDALRMALRDARRHDRLRVERLEEDEMLFRAPKQDGVGGGLWR